MVVTTDADDSALSKRIETHLISKSPSFVALPRVCRRGEVVDLESGSFIKRDITEQNRLAVVAVQTQKKLKSDFKPLEDPRKRLKLRLAVNRNHVSVKLPVIKKSSHV